MHRSFFVWACYTAFVLRAQLAWWIFHRCSTPSSRSFPVQSMQNGRALWEGLMMSDRRELQGQRTPFSISDQNSN